MASISQACRLLRSTQLRNLALTRGFGTTGYNAVAKNYKMPAMSPTMTEGNIVSWKVKEGDRFKAGDVLLEIETDKAQIDVESPEDGILAKIFIENGTKGIEVGTRIAVLAEPDDDLSTLKIPDEPKSSSPTPKEPKPEDKPKAAPPTSEPSHKATSKGASSSSHVPKSTHRFPKEPFSPSPSVMALLHRNSLTKDDIRKIPATGPRGRLLKGDVLAYVGAISKDGPANIESIVDRLSHLDLSNIKVKQAPAPTPEKETAGDKKAAASAKPIMSETDIQIEVCLEKLMKFQNEVQDVMGFLPPVSAFLGEASRKASQNLPPSKIPPTSSELFNELLGLPKKVVPKTYIPQLTSLPPPPAFPSFASKKFDIIDILSSARPKRPVQKVLSTSIPTTVNIISVKVKKEDEKRGKVFLDRVKKYIEAEPEKLFASWSEGVKKSASAELF